MLSKILSVAGRPGLYKLISTNKTLNVVESFADGKRIPVYAQEKMVALSDVSIYTESGDTPLRDVLTKMKERENGAQIALGSKSPNNEIFAYMKEILPDYDTEKVYASDIKKLISWYNILIEHNIDLEEQPTEETSAEVESEA
ncbi:MAG: DUF5606 domain-containing protein [Dysgonamonadaceae bacterium]|jgi:hypothetical protein|nr:DUF5606 domain-containing protein [Dysgonamonadaceae bacterium]